MKSYTAHHKSVVPADILNHSEQVQFVREGFAWPAFFIPPIWFLFHRLWLVFIGYLVVVGVFGAVAELLQLSDFAVGSIVGALHLICGFEGNNLRRRALARRGYEELGLITGRSFAECEQRFFEYVAAQREIQILPQSTPPQTRTPVAAPKPDDEALGLFPTPEGQR